MAELIRREYAERYIEKYEKSKAAGDVMAQITCCSKLACIFSHFSMYEYAAQWAKRGLKKCAVHENRDFVPAIRLQMLEIFSRICNTKHNSKLFCTKEFDKRLQELLSYDAVFSSLELARIHLLRTEKSLREGAAEEAAVHLRLAKSELGSDNSLRVSAVTDRIYLFDCMVRASRAQAAIMVFSEERAKQKCGDAALMHLEEALKTAAELGSNLYQHEINREIAGIYQQRGDYMNALRYLENSSWHKKSMIKDQSLMALVQKRYSKVRKKARIYEKQYADIDRIYSICQKISSRLEYDEIVEILYSEARQLFSLDILLLAQYDSKNARINRATYVENGKTNRIEGFATGEKSTVGEHVLNVRESILINDRDSEYSRYIDQAKQSSLKEGRPYPQSMIYCPLFIGEVSTGYISIQSFSRGAYTAEDVYKLETIAAYLSIALENSDLYHAIEHSVSHDFLTGLSSRREIFVKGKKRYFECVTSGSPFSLVMIDIDYLKKINDAYGHRTGDRLLTEASDIIRLHSRAGDISARYGGEEFILILPETDIEGASKVAERIREQFENHAFCSECGQEISFTGSFGVYQYDTFKNEEFEHGLTAVDEALYQAKKSGRNRISYMK